MYRIFIVDDEVGIVNGLEKILDWEQLGCVTTCFSNSVDAYESALAGPPDILITDIKMPLMDGLELIRKLRAAGNKSAVIILSGFSEFEYAQKGISLGIDAYILKPIEEEELLSAVTQAMKHLEDQNSIKKELEKIKSNVRSETAPLLEQSSPEKDDIVEKVKQYIDLHFTENLSLYEIAGHFHLNPNYLSELFGKKTGHTYKSYLTGKRMEKAKKLLLQNVKLYEVCHSVGYEDIRHFSRAFTKVVGVKPSSFRTSGNRNI